MNTLLSPLLSDSAIVHEDDLMPCMLLSLVSVVLRMQALLNTLKERNNNR